MELIVKNLSNLNFETHNIQVVNQNEYQDILNKKMKSLKISKKKKKESDRFSVIFFYQDKSKEFNEEKEVLNINFSSVYLVNKQIPTFKKILYSIESLVDKLNIDPLYINEYSKQNLYVVGLSLNDKSKFETDKRKQWRTWLDFIPGNFKNNINEYLIKNKTILNGHVYNTNLENKYECKFSLLDVYKSMDDYTNNL